MLGCSVLVEFNYSSDNVMEMAVRSSRTKTINVAMLLWCMICMRYFVKHRETSFLTQAAINT